VKVIVVGQGEVGLPLYHVLEDSGKFEVVSSYDMVDAELPRGNFEIMHICFPYSPEFEKSVIEYANKFGPELIIIESTVLPGTTRRIAKNVKSFVAHSPVLGRVHDSFNWALLAYTKFIGPMDKMIGLMVKDHYEKLGMKTYIADQPEDTEWAKILETSYWGLLLGWHQELERISSAFDLDTKTILNFFQNVENGSKGKIPRPVLYVGNIGGHCVIPNSRLLLSLYDSNFVASIVRSQLAFEASMQRVYNYGEDATCVLCGEVYTRKVRRNQTNEPFFIITCLTCKDIMFVFRAHREPTEKEMKQALDLARTLYPNCEIDTVRRSIPKHPYFHVRGWT